MTNLPSTILSSNNARITQNTLSIIINNFLISQCILNNEEVAHDNIMKKREAIVQKHINTVYPIKELFNGGKRLYYTKLQPNNRGHERKISSKSMDDLHNKIIAYYLEIEYQNKTTISDVLEMALLDLTPETASRHRQIFNKHFSMLGPIKVAQLTENDVRECLQSMLSKGIKSKAFNNATSTLNKINDYCVYNHINIINIRDKVSEFRKCKMVGKKVFIKDNKKEAELAFSENEAVTIINYTLEHPDYINLAISTLITTGLRAGELLALTIDDINIQNGTLNIDKSEKTKSYEIVNRCKDDSDRTVFLNSDAILILKKVIALREADSSNCGYLFLNHLSDDDKLHLRALDNRLRKIQHILKLTDKLPERSPHDCRRTYASIQYLHGIDIKTIQAQLGHSSAQQTWDYIKDIIDTNTRAQKLEKGCILSA